MRRLSVPLVLLALLLTACGNDDGDGEDDVSTDGGEPTTDVTYADLDGTTFVSTGATGYEIVADTTISLTFEDERISVAAGCNNQNAGVEVVDGQLRLTSELAGTMMACEEPLMAQDQWVASFLEADPDVVVDGDALTLTVGDEVLELSAEP